MRCFEVPSEHKQLSAFKESLLNTAPHPIAQWLEQQAKSSVFSHQLSILTAEQTQALARLIPLLLCGEQSAVHIFNQESLRLCQNIADSSDQQAVLDYSKALEALTYIEADERYHEQALQFILAALPTDKEQHKIKRQAQLFYTRIAQNTASLADHFEMIAKLDRCVCILMDAVSKSSLQGSELATLFELIKKDEAKHVGFARKHSQQLRRADTTQHTDNKDFDVQARLVILLTDHNKTFERLGINSQALFERLLKKHSFHEHPLQDIHQ